MRRRFPTLVFALLFLVMTAVPAQATTYTELDQTPKQGLSGMLECRGEATAGGDTYVRILYVGYDTDQPTDTERRWQEGRCGYYMTGVDPKGGAPTHSDVIGWFKYQKGIDIAPSDVSYSWKHLP